MIATTEILCDILGVTDRIVSKWVGAGCPVAVRGGAGRGSVSKFDTRDVILWLRDRAVARATKNTPDARLRAAQAQLAELDLAERTGALIAVADVEPIWTSAILAARAELLNLPPRLKSALDARYGINVDQQMLEEPVHEALRKLSESPPADEGDDDEAPKPENSEDVIFENEDTEINHEPR